MAADILERILKEKRDWLASLKKSLNSEQLQRAALAAPVARDFKAALRAAKRQGGMGLIAEIKRRSPSRGEINGRIDAGDYAWRYQRGGADCLSVLTDSVHFGGGFADLARARRHTSLPILCKDFIIDEVQVYLARAAGADSVLLIAAALSTERLATLLRLARSLGMEPLVEVHNLTELRSALPAGPRLLGVNNRNLSDFSVDLSRCIELIDHIPTGATVVAESGIKTGEDVRRLQIAGFGGVLVGETIAGAKDPEAAIGALRSGCVRRGFLVLGGKRPSGLVAQAPVIKRMVKICGLTRLTDVRAAAQSGCNALGFVLVPSFRAVTPRFIKEALRLARSCRRGSQEGPPLSVGVVPPLAPGEAVRLVKECGLDCIQMHGDWPLELLRKVLRLLRSSPPQVMVGRAAHRLADCRAAARLGCDFIVFDSPPSGGLSGGSGRMADWELAARVRQAIAPVPLVVAGGLRPGNVTACIRRVAPAGVDVSSGVEGRTRGQKNEALIREFVVRAQWAFAYD